MYHCMQPRLNRKDCFEPEMMDMDLTSLNSVSPFFFSIFAFTYILIDNSREVEGNKEREREEEFHVTNGSTQNEPGTFWHLRNDA